jgi:hypothetical protein
MPTRRRMLGVVWVVVFALWGPWGEAHQSGCHRWHSCPSDTGSYICGDLGYCSGQTPPRPPGSSSLLVIQVHGSKITTSEERVADWKILVNQGRNKHSLHDELSYHLVFTKSGQEPESELIFRECGFVAPHICSDCELKTALVCELKGSWGSLPNPPKRYISA